MRSILVWRRCKKDLTAYIADDMLNLISCSLCQYPLVFVQEKWQDVWPKLQLHQLHEFHPHTGTIIQRYHWPWGSRLVEWANWERVCWWQWGWSGGDERGWRAYRDCEFCIWARVRWRRPRIMYSYLQNMPCIPGADLEISKERGGGIQRQH